MERVRRVEERLQAGRPAGRRLTVEVPWLQTVTAFTAPGRYVYISRGLFERCPEDEQVALVAAHEIAHHDLGHVKLLAGWASTFAGLPSGVLLTALYRGVERRIYGPEKECAADRRGLELCLAAGYDGERCLELLGILEQHALDLGDLDIVFGPDEQSDNELAEDADWKTRIQIWLWQRARGYLPIRDRRQMLLEYLAARSV